MTNFITGLKRFCKHILSFWKITEFPNIDKTARIDPSVKVYNPNNLIMEENTNIDHGAVLMNTRAKIIIKKNSGAAFGLVAVTGNHMSVVGKNLKQVSDRIKDELDVNHEMDKDIIVEEDVWMGNHVTLLSGVKIGRGSEIGAGSVVRSNIPPYAVVIGNPAKIVGFRFTPEEIVEHEKVQYDESERISKDKLDKNYEKYFLNRMKEVKQITKL